MNEHSNSGGRILLIIIATIVVLGGAIGAWYWLSYKPEQDAKEQARLEQVALEQAEQKRKEDAAKREAEYDRLINEADAAFDQEEWELAQSSYSRASSLFPNQDYPKSQLILVNEKLDELAALEAKRAAGIVETVSEPTNRFYVIVSSSIDDDLASDYASKLASEGNNVKLVKHNANELPFHGVSVADYDTWEQAEAALPTYSNFGAGVWVLKF
ncbi:hypothetical protein [Ekhidna sp.]|uniref:hypothetical protein n=1 Tax=Ekhidna sp. TaxID=2608089 RepID=UPI0032969F3C